MFADGSLPYWQVPSVAPVLWPMMPIVVVIICLLYALKTDVRHRSGFCRYVLEIVDFLGHPDPGTKEPIRRCPETSVTNQPTLRNKQTNADLDTRKLMQDSCSLCPKFQFSKEMTCHQNATGGHPKAIVFIISCGQNWQQHGRHATFWGDVYVLKRCTATYYRKISISCNIYAECRLIRKRLCDLFFVFSAATATGGDRQTLVIRQTITYLYNGIWYWNTP